MAYYWQADGEDDQIVIPTLIFDEIILTLKGPFSNDIMHFTQENFASVFFYTSDSETSEIGVWSSLEVYQNSWTASVDGAGRVSANGVKLGSQKRIVSFKTSIAPTGNTPGNTPNIYISSGGNNYYSTGNWYDIKVLRNGVTQAHYDLTLGHAQDISGNGKHATLYGGTWVVDPDGGEIEPGVTPTEVTYNVPLRQSIHLLTTSDYSTKQTIRKQNSNNHLTKQYILKTEIVDSKVKQIVYKQTTANNSMKNYIYKPTPMQIQMQQNMYKQVITDFLTEQIVTAILSQITDFAIKQLIYKPVTSSNPIKQSVFVPLTYAFNTKNIIYKVSISYSHTQQTIILTSTTIADFTLKQIISKSVSDNHQSKQLLYINQSDEHQTSQRLFSVNVNDRLLRQEIFKLYQDETHVTSSLYKQTTSTIPLKVLIYTNTNSQYPLRQMIYKGDSHYQKVINMSFEINREIHLNVNINRNIELTIYI